QVTFIDPETLTQKLGAASLSSSATVAGGGRQMYFVDRFGTVTALESNGDMWKRRSLDQGSVAFPAVSGNHVHVATTAGLHTLTLALKEVAFFPSRAPASPHPRSDRTERSMLPLARSCTPSRTTFPPPEAAFTICELSLTVVDPRSTHSRSYSGATSSLRKFACNRRRRCFRRRVQQSHGIRTRRPGLACDFFYRTIGRVQPGLTVGEIIDHKRDGMTVHFIANALFVVRLDHAEIVVLQDYFVCIRSGFVGRLNRLRYRR